MFGLLKYNRKVALSLFIVVCIVLVHQTYRQTTHLQPEGMGTLLKLYNRAPVWAPEPTNSVELFEVEHTLPRDEVITNSEPPSEAPGLLPRRNLMFIKTHKCGTSSLVNIFYLYGVRRRLNFVLQEKEKNHVLTFGKGDEINGPLLQPRPGGTWNIQCQHGTFNPKVEHQLFDKESTLFSTILRSPVSHFVSSFRFFGAENRMKKKYGAALPLEGLVNKFLDELREPSNVHGVPTSRFLNSAAVDLGWEAFRYRLGKTDIHEKISKFVAHIDNEMDFVMITDRIDESLVLLKEYLGWNLTDILYLNRMISGKKKEGLSDATKERVMKYNLIDSQLFHHFNQTFEKHLDRVGREKVALEVKQFRELRELFENKCFDKKTLIKGTYGSVSWALSDYGKNENLSCQFLQTRDVILTKVIAYLQLSQDYTVPVDKPETFPAVHTIVKQIQTDFDLNKFTFSPL